MSGSATCSLITSSGLGNTHMMLLHAVSMTRLRSAIRRTTDLTTLKSTSRRSSGRNEAKIFSLSFSI